MATQIHTFRNAILAVIGLGIFVTVGLADTIRVPADQPTIQAGIDAASAGDVVLAADGVYTGPGNRDIDFRGKAITVRSENGAESCIIDCGRSGRGFIFQNAETPKSVVEGFTIRNGREGRGGGVKCVGSSPTVVRCVFDGNFAVGDGGGMYNELGSNPIVKLCTFLGNRATHGAGMANSASRPVVTDCLFVFGFAYPEGVGGGIYNEGSDPLIANCTFRENQAGDEGFGLIGGGGIGNDDSSPSVIDCTFEGNLASFFGGGMASFRFSNPLIVECIFRANRAGSGGGISSWGDAIVVNCSFIENVAFDTRAFGGGGGIANFDNLPIVTNCRFISNSAGKGGGMYNSSAGAAISGCLLTGNLADKGAGMYFFDDSGSTVTDCTFTANDALEGGALFTTFFSRTPLSLDHCTLAANQATHGPALATNDDFGISSSVEMTNCVLWNGGDEIWNNDQSQITIGFSDVRGGFPGDGNIDADPLFVDPLNGDFHISPESPCIDTGDPGFAGEPGETDIDGQKRVWNRRVDMGSDESGSHAFGDLNCDGSVNAFDIEPFILALFSPGEYSVRYPDCEIELADLNFDGVVDAFDIEPFLNLLFP